MSEPRRPRHRPEVGYARGDETRRRIIEVAIRLFGERGYEGASTRDIAKQAGVNAPALQYYFDSKEGLYQACAEHIVESSATHFAPSLDAAQTVLDRPDASRDELIEAFGVIQDAIADQLLLSYDAQARRLFMAQEQAGQGPGMASELMQRKLRSRMNEVCKAIVARVTGRATDDPITVIRIMTVHGQLMVFHIVPRAMLASLGWDRINDERLALLKSTVRSQTRVLMDSWAAEDAATR